MKGRKKVVWVGGATAFSLLGDQTLYAVLPTYYLELGLMPWHVGILLSANRLVRVFINHWSERISRTYFTSFALYGFPLYRGAFDGGLRLANLLCIFALGARPLGHLLDLYPPDWPDDCI